MRIAVALILSFLVFADAHASVELSAFMTQRNAFVAAAEDGGHIDLFNGLSGDVRGEIGLARRFFPVGLDASWHLRGFGQTGPLARVRVSPWVVQLRKGLEPVEGWDGQLAVGHSWAGPSVGALSTSFEFGFAVRKLLSTDEEEAASTTMAGRFWGLILNHGPWTFHTESALMAFSMGSHGKWGRHRDSNWFRIRLSRILDEESKWRGFVEYNHLRRTFTNSRFGFSEGLFVSDYALSVGLTAVLD